MIKPNELNKLTQKNQNNIEDKWWAEYEKVLEEKLIKTAKEGETQLYLDRLEVKYYNKFKKELKKNKYEVCEILDHKDFYHPYRMILVKWDNKKSNKIINYFKKIIRK